jgi:hypothetical protein
MGTLMDEASEHGDESDVAARRFHGWDAAWDGPDVVLTDRP